MRKSRFSDDEGGVASILGEVLTVGIVVAIIGVGGAAALQNIGAPHATADTQLRAVLDCGSGAWYDGDELIVIYHRGGASLDSGALELRLNINGQVSQGPMGSRVASSEMLEGGGVHGRDISAIGQVDPAVQAALDAAAAAEAAAQAAEAAAVEAAAAAAASNETAQLAEANADAEAAAAAASAAAWVLDEVGTRNGAADVLASWAVTAGIASGLGQPSLNAKLAQGEVARSELQAWLDQAPLGAATPTQIDEIGWASDFLAQKVFTVSNSAAQFTGPDPALEQAADVAAADAADARVAADEAAADAEAAASSGFSAPEFDVGGAWVSGNMTLRQDAYVSYTILQQAAGASSIIADGILTERLCGGISTIMGIAKETFGVLPFIDKDCDGVAGIGDELLERTDFDDGYFVVSGAVGCLIIPAGIEAIEAESIHLQAPNGVTVEVNLKSTNGPIEILGGDGLVDASGIRIDSSEGVAISGQSIDVSHSDITAPGGRFSLQAQDGPITAKGMKVVAGLAGGSSTPEPIVDLPNQSGPGSIRMCVALLDSTNRVTNGWQWHERSFTVGGRGGVPGYPAEGILPDLTVHAPLPLNADIFYNDGIKDAHCVLYNDLEIGGWFYKQGVVDNPTNWEVSLHNDQNAAAITTVDDFFHYSGELFDGDPGNDGSRNQDADGHISLTSSRPYRTMVALLRSTDTIGAEIAIDSDGGDIDLSDAEFLAHNADVAVDSDGGAIIAHRFKGTAAGSLGQVRIDSAGGPIAAIDAELIATSGHVRVLAGVGALDLSGTSATGRYGVDLSGGPHIDLSGTTLDSAVDHVDVLVSGSSVNVNQAGARVTDSDAKGSVMPAPSAPTSTAVLVGTPSLNGFAIA